MDISTTHTVLALAQSQRKERYVYSIQPSYTPGTTIDQYSINIGNVNEPNPVHLELCSLLGVSDHSQLSITHIWGDLTTHTDGWLAPLRLLWLLSPNTVSISMEGIEGVYTTGDCCVLNSRKPHNALIQSGVAPQTWILAHAPDRSDIDIPDSVWDSMPKEHLVFRDRYGKI